MCAQSDGDDGDDVDHRAPHLRIRERGRCPTNSFFLFNTIIPRDADKREGDIYPRYIGNIPLIYR